MSRSKPDEGRYSRISRRVWGSKDFRALSAPKPNAQTLWLRLLSGPELGVIPGLYEVRESGLAEALGWPLAAFRRCLKEITDRGMASHDKATGLMWVPKGIHHNAPDNPNIIVGWKTAWKDLPDCPLKDTANVYLKGWCVERGQGWVTSWDKVTGNVSPNVPSESPPRIPGTSGKPDSDTETDSDTDYQAEPIGGGEPDDPGRETICPLGIAARADANGTLAELAEKLAEPIDAVRHEARQFEAYWVLGKGAGKRRTGWMGKLRQWIVDQHGKGGLAPVPAAKPEAPKPERVRTYADVQREEAAREAASAARRAAGT